jgi:hypothetical protein
MTEPRLRAYLGGVSPMWIPRHQVPKAEGGDGFPRPAFYSGGKKFYRIADVEAWIAAQSKEPPQWLKLAGQKGEESAARARAAKAAREAEAAAAPEPVKPAKPTARKTRSKPLAAE